MSSLTTWIHFFFPWKGLTCQEYPGDLCILSKSPFQAFKLFENFPRLLRLALAKPASHPQSVLWDKWNLFLLALGQSWFCVMLNYRLVNQYWWNTISTHTHRQTRNTHTDCHRPAIIQCCMHRLLDRLPKPVAVTQVSWLRHKEKNIVLKLFELCFIMMNNWAINAISINMINNHKMICMMLCWEK